MTLRIVHLELKEANALVGSLHRHHKPVVGHRFSIGTTDTGRLVGAAIVGRPVARELDWRKILEVTRLVTDGTKHACSALYAAVARAGRELGYEHIQTYILDSEPGTSLIAAGWEFEAADHRQVLEYTVTRGSQGRSTDGTEATVGQASRGVTLLTLSFFAILRLTRKLPRHSLQGVRQIV